MSGEGGIPIEQSPQLTGQKIVETKNINVGVEPKSKPETTISQQISSREEYVKICERISKTKALEDPMEAFRKPEVETRQNLSEKSREFSKKDVIRHKFLELEARRQGVKDIASFNALVGYFETKLDDYKFYHFKYKANISEEELNREIEELRKKGINILPRGKEKEESEVELAGYKRIPFNVSRENISVIKAFLETGNNPTPLFETLGMGVSDLRLRPETTKFIDLLKNQYSVESLEKVKILSKTLEYRGLKVDIDNIPACVGLVNNPDKLEILATAFREYKIPQNYNFSLLDSLNSLESNGLTKPLADLIRSGIKIDERFFGGELFDRPSQTQDEVNQNLQKLINDPSVQDILQSQDKRMFAQILNKMTGEKILTSDISELYSKRQELIAISKIVFQSGIEDIKWPRWRSSYERKLSCLKSLVESEKQIEYFFDPEFQNFLRDLSLNKNINLEPDDFMHQVNNPFFDKYHPDPSQGQEEEGLMIQLFRQKEWMNLIDSPNIEKEIIEGFRYGSDWEKSSSKADKDFDLLSSISANRDLKIFNFFKQNNLKFKPETISLIMRNRYRPFLVDNIFTQIPEKEKLEWINAALRLPERMQDSLGSHFFYPEKGEEINSVIERVFALSKALSSCSLPEEELNRFYYSLNKTCQIIAGYKGDLTPLFTNGKPNAEFIKLVCKLKDSDSLTEILNDELLSEFEGNDKLILGLWRVLPGDLKKEFIKEVPDFPKVPPESADKYKAKMEVMMRIKDSPSAEVKKLEKELIEQLWKLKDPSKALEEIISIFEKNNLPLVGKIYRVFETIYDNPNTPRGTTLEQNLSSNPNLSPVLRAANTRERRDIIYKDLVSIHIKSGNPQLRNYLEVLNDGENVVSKFENNGISSLSDRERLLLGHFFNKMDMLYQSSLFGRTIENRKRQRQIDSSPVTSDLSFENRLQALRRNLHVRADKSLNDRISEMFLKPIGLSNFEEALSEMDHAKEKANSRNREYIKSGNGKITFAAGDRLKGVDVSNLGKILERGIVAREYLGASSGSDATPYDSDTGLILKEDLTNGVAGAISASPANGYGDMLLVIKDRGQFGAGKDQYESFGSGVAGKRHYGVRTGFPSTEIDAVIVKEGITSDNKKLDDLFMAIAQNGVYIPVGTTNGDVIFTPEKFDDYRKTFDGVGEYSSVPVKVERLGMDRSEDDFIRNDQITKDTILAIDQFKKAISENRERIVKISSEIRRKVGDALSSIGVKLRDEFDTSIYGAQLVDIGSTARGSNLPGDFDFDFSLQLDPNDVKRMQEIASAVKNSLKLQEAESDKSHTETDFVQVRAIGSKIIEGEIFDVDIGIGKRSDEGVFASNEAIAQKLDSIRTTLGDDTYYEILANIVLAKKILKENHAYKKLEDGGLGGIGVENWILLNDGNILNAFQTFWKAAHEGDRLLGYEEFAKRYKIFDAGINIKYNSHDNFVRVLKPEGYNAMIKAIGGYLFQSS